MLLQLYRCTLPYWMEFFLCMRGVPGNVQGIDEYPFPFRVILMILQFSFIVKMFRNEISVLLIFTLDECCYVVFVNHETTQNLYVNWSKKWSSYQDSISKLHLAHQKYAESHLLMKVKGHTHACTHTHTHMYVTDTQ